jgi:hypothetical protein
MSGFFCGTLFSIVLGVAGHDQRFDRLSLSRFAVWGAIGGFLLGLVPAAMVAAELATANGNIWLITLGFSVPLMLLGAGSASATVALARTSEGGEVLEERTRDGVSPSRLNPP